MAVEAAGDGPHSSCPQSPEAPPSVLVCFEDDTHLDSISQGESNMEMPSSTLDEDQTTNLVRTHEMGHSAKESISEERNDSPSKPGNISYSFTVNGTSAAGSTGVQNSGVRHDLVNYAQISQQQKREQFHQVKPQPFLETHKDDVIDLYSTSESSNDVAPPQTAEAHPDLPLVNAVDKQTATAHSNAVVPNASDDDKNQEPGVPRPHISSPTQNDLGLVIATSGNSLVQQTGDSASQPQEQQGEPMEAMREQLIAAQDLAMAFYRKKQQNRLEQEEQLRRKNLQQTLKQQRQHNQQQQDTMSKDQSNQQEIILKMPSSDDREDEGPSKNLLRPNENIPLTLEAPFQDINDENNAIDVDAIPTVDRTAISRATMPTSGSNNLMHHPTIQRQGEQIVQPEIQRLRHTQQSEHTQKSVVIDLTDAANSTNDTGSLASTMVRAEMSQQGPSALINAVTPLYPEFPPQTHTHEGIATATSLVPLQQNRVIYAGLDPPRNPPIQSLVVQEYVHGADQIAQKMKEQREQQSRREHHILAHVPTTAQQQYQHFQQLQQQQMPFQHFPQQHHFREYQSRQQQQQQQQQLSQVPWRHQAPNSHVMQLYDLVDGQYPLFTEQNKRYQSLTPLYRELTEDFICTGSHVVLLRMKLRDPRFGTSQQSNISWALNNAYCQSVYPATGRTPHSRPSEIDFPKNVLVLACRRCFKEGVYLRRHGDPTFDRQSLQFPANLQLLISQFYQLQQHLIRCPYLQMHMRQIISREFSVQRTSSTRMERELNFLRQMCKAYNLFSLPAVVVHDTTATAAIPFQNDHTDNVVIIDDNSETTRTADNHRVGNSSRPQPTSIDNLLLQSIYNDNAFAIQIALEKTSMTFRGVIGEKPSDMVDLDIVGDDRFCLFAVESLEVIRIHKDYSLPEYKCFFASELMSEDRMKEVFILQCRNCHGRSKLDGSRNDDAMVMLRSNNDSRASKEDVIKFMQVALKHLPKCLTGPRKRRLQMLMGTELSKTFMSHVASSGVRNLRTISECLNELQGKDFAVVPPARDTELWTSFSMKQHQHQELIRTIEGNPFTTVNIVGLPKKKGAPGSKVLGFEVFPRWGLLHDAMGLPTINDMKMANLKRRRPTADNPYGELKKKRLAVPGSKVLEVEML